MRGTLVSVLDLDSAAVDPRHSHDQDHRTHTRVTAGNAFLSLNDVKRRTSPSKGGRRSVRLDGQAFA